MQCVIIIERGHEVELIILAVVYFAHVTADH